MRLKRQSRSVAGFMISIRPHQRATRIKLTVDPLSGDVRVSGPSYMTHADVDAFVMRHQAWIRRQLDKRAPQAGVGPGMTVSLKGEPVTCVQEDRLRGVVRQDGDRLLVPGAPESFERRLKDFFRAEARQVFTTAVVQYDQKLQDLRPDARRLGKLTVRDTRSRWGSCAANGNISLSWRLIMAPPPVASYVVAHEVAHLAEANHSAAFWDLCQGLYGAPTDTPRAWLKQYGAQLFTALR